MADAIPFSVWQKVQAQSGSWYQNLQYLGAGGNATTFLALATSGPNCGVLFALKVFRTLSKSERRESFLQEMAFLRGCDHPSVMRIYDAGVYHEEYPFFVAEYLPKTLHQAIRAGESSLVVKISYALQLLSALAYLAGREPPVVHRDIKPRNIFIKGNSCVLGDFGLIKHIDAETTEDREVFKESAGVGMPFRYRTPDQVAYLRNEAMLGPASDVYQLGLVLTELFTGRNPQKPAHDFTDPVELENLGFVRGGPGGQISGILGRMLERDPAARRPASEFLTLWQGIFISAARQAHGLEGRVIW